MKAREFEAAVCNSSIAGGLEGGRLGGLFGKQSPTGYGNPQLTRLLEGLGTTADPDARDQAYREMSDLLRRDQPIAFLYGAVGAHVVHRRVKGLNAPWWADPLKFTDDLWLEKG